MSKDKSSQQSPGQYLKSGNARRLPIYKCWATKNFTEFGVCNVIVTRQHKNGNLTAGFYLADLYCLGIKDTYFKFNWDKEEIESMFSEAEDVMEEVSYAFAHNLIYGADVYCEELGLSSHHDFKTTQYILDEDTDAVELIEFEFGRNNRPTLIINPGERRRLEIRILEEKFGKDGFDILEYRGYGDEGRYEKMDNDDDNFDGTDGDWTGVYAEREELLKQINDNDKPYLLDVVDMDLLSELFPGDEMQELTEDDFGLIVEKMKSANPPEAIFNMAVDDIYEQRKPGFNLKADGVKFYLPVLNQEPEDFYAISPDYDEVMDTTSDILNEFELDEDIVENFRAVKHHPESVYCALIFHLRHEDAELVSSIAEQYWEAYPESIVAKANMLLSSACHIESDDFGAIIEKSVGTFERSLNFFESNPITGTHYLIEVSSFLFLQGMLAVANDELYLAEACLKKMAVLRAKNNDFFLVLRNLVTAQKVSALDLDS